MTTDSIFPIFTDNDFNVFSIPGLEPRMNALIERVRPKLARIGDELAPFLSAHCGEPMYPHVAKHARRTINPPDDTWVAWANNKKGYKAHPHFQVGLWSTHLFIQFAIIYESTNKSVFADQLTRHGDAVLRAIPGDFRWSMDHMQPETTAHGEMTEEGFERLTERLRRVKKSEALCGIRIMRGDPVLSDPDAFRAITERTFATLLPLYRLAF